MTEERNLKFSLLRDGRVASANVLSPAEVSVCVALKPSTYSESVLPTWEGWAGIDLSSNLNNEPVVSWLGRW